MFYFRMMFRVINSFHSKIELFPGSLSSPTLSFYFIPKHLLILALIFVYRLKRPLIIRLINFKNPIA